MAICPGHHPDRHSSSTIAVLLERSLTWLRVFLFLSSSQVASHINESLRRFENQMACLAAQNKFKPALKLVAPQREFKREADLVKINRAGRRDTYRCFLFSDVLVYGHELLGAKGPSNVRRT